jgi:NDP-sugar pyrophosphorylase family protein
MIAIIIAGVHYPEMYGLDEHLPVSLLPLVDRPIVHHLIEYLVVQGITRFEFILNHLPEEIESNLGTGARWGCSFGFHLFPTSGNPYRVAQTIASGLDEDILLGRMDCLPEFRLAALPDPSMYCLATGGWTGWAVLPRRSSEIGSLNEPSGIRHFTDLCRIVTVERVMDFRTSSALLRSQSELLSGNFPCLMINGRQTEPGIWISRNVSLHPTVSLSAPVYIGPNSKISRGVKIGPMAVISENCILDEQSSVENSLVTPGTYIGQGLELNQVIVDRNRLVNAKIGTSFLVSETFLLSSLTEHTTHHPIQQLFSRLGALLLLLALWPLTAFIFFYFTVCRKGNLIHERAIRIPANNNPVSWREYWIPRFRLHSGAPYSRWASFFLELWPGLFSVLKGELFLVGVQPRSRKQVESLPDDWRSIYLKSKSGLITEAAVMFGESPNDDELYTAEAYYSATESFRHDLALTFLYFWKMIAESGRSAAGLAQDSRP